MAPSTTSDRRHPRGRRHLNDDPDGTGADAGGWPSADRPGPGDPGGHDGGGRHLLGHACGAGDHGAGVFGSGATTETLLQLDHCFDDEVPDASVPKGGSTDGGLGQ